MTENTALLEEVAAMAARLSPQEQLRLIERLAAGLEHGLTPRQPAPLRSLYGLWAGMGPDLSAEEIDESRREVWANFPREDI